MAGENRPSGAMPQTAWTLVKLAGIDSPQGRAALGELVRDYWTPVYHYLRKRGHAPHEADDLTQGFFEHFLQGELVRTADRERGHFRDLIKTAIRRYAVDAHRHDHAHRRGGAEDPLPFDFASAEDDYATAIRDDHTPEDALHQSWALALTRRIHDNLATYYADRGAEHKQRFELLSRFALEEPERGEYILIGEQLGLTKERVSLFVHRFRQRWRQMAIVEAMRTTGTAKEGEEELRALGFGEWLGRGGDG